MSRTTWLGTLAVLGSILLTSCAASEAGTTHDSSHSTHTMPDGTVMDDSAMAEPETRRPSAAARMVCAGDVVEDVTRILAVTDAPDPVPSWTEPVFTCTYELEAGPLVLSVHDATDPKAGRDYFESLRSRLGEVQKLRGLESFGLPAYETDDGSVVFLRDGKTLHVDATALHGDLGPDGSLSRNDVAYAVAASVIACWTEHA
ncbi:MAG TPA: hypothetical protein VFG72_13825 [Marmoricola sp.]|nr:hypothetical protein [Marmoricola sp.]